MLRDINPNGPLRPLAINLISVILRSGARHIMMLAMTTKSSKHGRKPSPLNTYYESVKVSHLINYVCCQSL
jgi:hypothetical protein